RRLTWKGHDKSRAQPQFRLDFDAPFMPFHDAASNRQAQPSSVPTFFGGQKRFEDMRQYDGSDAGSVVAHPDLDFRLVVSVGVNQPILKPESATAGHGIDCIQDQCYEDLFNLGRIAEHER